MHQNKRMKQTRIKEIPFAEAKAEVERLLPSFQDEEEDIERFALAHLDLACAEMVSDGHRSYCPFCGRFVDEDEFNSDLRDYWEEYAQEEIKQYGDISYMEAIEVTCDQCGCSSWVAFPLDENGKVPDEPDDDALTACGTLDVTRAVAVGGWQRLQQLEVEFESNPVTGWSQTIPSCEAEWWYKPGSPILKVDRKTGKAKITQVEEIVPFYDVVCESVLPELEEMGFRETETSLSDFISYYMKSPFLKQAMMEGKTHLIPSNRLKDFITYGPSVRVALRHGFDPEKVPWGDFFDNVKALKDLGKDLRNPVFLCPPDFRKAHLENIMALERRRKKEEAEREHEYALRKLESLMDEGEKNESYIRRMAPYFGIVLTDGTLTARPLKDLKEFAEEGEAMHHCVFRMNYFDESKRCLILSVRDPKGERVETVEVNLKDFTVAQARGKYNVDSPFHEEVLKLIADGMNKIRAAAKEAKRIRKTDPAVA